MAFNLSPTHSLAPLTGGFLPIDPIDDFDVGPVFDSHQGVRVLRPAINHGSWPWDTEPHKPRTFVPAVSQWPAYTPGSHRRGRQEWLARAQGYIHVASRRKLELAIQSRQSRWQPIDTILVGIMLKGDSEGLDYGMAMIEKHLALDRHGLICGGWMQKPGETLAIETPPFDAHLTWLTELQLNTLLTFFILYFRERLGLIHHSLSPGFLLLHRSQNYLSQHSFDELRHWMRKIHSQVNS